MQMSVKKTVLAILYAVFTVAIIHAQQFPSSIKWKEMETPQLRIVYPEHLETYALKTAKYLDSIYYDVIYPFKAPKRVPLVFNSQTAIANGYAYWYPRKMEWHLQPSAYCGFAEWHKQLGSHEYRHITQYHAMNQWLIKFYHILFGYDTSGNIASLFFPDWFLEGDAVYTESLILRNGTVRSGFIDMPMYMIAGEYDPDKLDYHRIYFGSFNRFYPNRYSLGYHIVKYVNNKKGAYIWDSIVTEGSGYTLYGSLMDYVNKLGNIVDRIMVDLKKETVGYPQYDLDYLIKERPSPYAEDKYPVIISPDTIFFSRWEFDKIPGIYQYNPQTKQLKKIVSVPGTYFTANHHYLAWLEYREHPRWNKKVDALIRIYDLKTGKKFRLPVKGKYQSPGLSATGEDLVVVNYDKYIVPHLEIWDINKVSKIKDLAFPQFESIRHPRFQGKAKQIVFSAIPHGGSNGIYRFDLTTGKIENLFNAENINVFFPRIYKNYLVFQADMYGYMGTYMKDLQKKDSPLSYITDSKYGSYTFETKGDSLCFSEMTKTGMQLRCKKVYPWINTISQASQKPVEEEVVPIPIPLDTIKNEPVISHQRIGDLDEHGRVNSSNNSGSEIPIPVRQVKKPEFYYKVSKYNRLKSYINPYSWNYMISKDYQKKWALSAGVSMIDILDENYLSMGFDYNLQHEFSAYLQWEYSRFFPVIGYRYSRDTRLGANSPYLNLTVYTRIPLKFNSGIWERSITFSAMAGSSTNRTGFYTPIGTYAYFSTQRMKAYRHVDNRWKSEIQLEYGKEPRSDSRLIRGMIGFNVPGLGKNDILSVNLIGERNSGNYAFGYWTTPVRGLSPTVYRSLDAIQLTYHAPLTYPDWGWKPVFNIKRIRYKLFWDKAWYDGQYIQSTGIQLLGDWNFLGYRETTELGFQTAYLSPLNTWHFSVVFNKFFF